MAHIWELKQKKWTHLKNHNSIVIFRNVFLDVFSLHVSRYLYGFEEYCRSANIEFQMALPEKVVNKPCKECENVKEIKVKEENESEIKEVKIEEEENIIPKEEKPTEDDIERKENIKPSLVNQIQLMVLCFLWYIFYILCKVSMVNLLYNFILYFLFVFFIKCYFYI